MATIIMNLKLCSFAVLSLCFVVKLKCQPTVEGGFSVIPEAIVQAEGVNATFYCSHPLASATGWNLNGTSVNRIHPIDVYVGTLNGGSLHYLTILATPKYNGTIVQCFAFTVDNGGNSYVETPPVTFFVQGILNAVMNIIKVPSVTSIIVTWEPPFSMNLTHAEPDVVYCVDIFNATSNQSQQVDDLKLLISDCSVLDTQYTYTQNDPDPTNAFEVKITPRSNVEGARNGTPSENIPAFFYIQPSVCAERVTVEINQDDLSLRVNNPNWTGEVTITVSIRTIDDKQHTINCECLITTGLSMTVKNNCTRCSKFIFKNRVYTTNVGCRNEIGMSESESTLSTHGIENVTVVNRFGCINFSCHFKTNSSSSGCLAVSQGVAVDNNSLPVFSYKIAHKVIDRASSSLLGLPVGDNKIAFYEIEESGLPGQYPAVTKNVIVSSLSQHQELFDEAFSNVTLYSNAQQICLSYSLRVAYSRCSIVYVPCTTEALHDQWNAISVHYTNGQEQTVCIEVDDECYSVAVFGMNKNGLLDTTPATAQLVTVKRMGAVTEPVQINQQKFVCEKNIYIFITLGVLLFICITIVILITSILLGKFYCNRSKRSNSLLSVERSETVQSEYETIIDLQKCTAYQTASEARAHGQQLN